MTIVAAVSADTGKPDCLYATVVGDDEIRVDGCEAPDPLQLARNPQIQKLMAAIGIPNESIGFRGCRGDVYALQPAPDSRYIVTYPPEVTEGFLAPIAHELAHIVQIRSAGGLNQLTDRYGSRRIELGADYLAGILFRRALPGVSWNDFQSHVRLKGLYRERLDRAHGTPVQRTAAFRFGVVGWQEKAGITLPDASDHFQENLYARVVYDD